MQAYPTERTVTLGSATGRVRIDFNAFAIPDRFIIEFDGAIVVDSKYRGNIGQITALHTALQAGNFTEPNNGVYTGHTYIGASTGAVDAPLPDPLDATYFVSGKGTLFFDKNTATTTATLKVYGPMTNTEWKCNNIVSNIIYRLWQQDNYFI